MSRFWNWVKNADKTRTLYLDGAISESTWWGDEITPENFRRELYSGDGDVIVWINSSGGDVFAAAAIYTMLKEYPGTVTVKIDAMAASAASVVAMAGDRVLISPVGHILIHNPSTIAIGDSEEMMKAKRLLDSVKDSIINAYEIKSGLSRIKLSNMMDVETDMPAQTAVALGFADEIMYQGDGDGYKLQIPTTNVTATYSPRVVLNSLLDKMRKNEIQETHETSGNPVYDKMSDTEIDTNPGVIINTEQRASLFNKLN